MSTAPRTVLFIGRSGCGKGTQAKLLLEYLTKTEPAPELYIETGKLLRSLAEGTSMSSQRVREMLAGGERMPDFLAIWNWGGVFVNQYTGAEHIIIDGACRSRLEAEALLTAFEFYKRVDPIVVYLDVSRDWAARHLAARGRGDDTAADIAERLRWFDTMVAPAIDYFRTASGCRLLTIPAERSIEEIHQDIVSQL